MASASDEHAELEEKQERVRRFLGEHNLSALALVTQASFAWATAGGDNHVSGATERGACILLLTPEKNFCLASRIEAPRISAEELEGLGFEMVEHEWFEEPAPALLDKVAPGPKASDAPLPGCTPMAAEIGQLRWSLTAQEVERYREAGRRAAEAMEEAILQVRPGMLEHEIASLLGSEVLARGMHPSVLLVAADERIFRYRHPIPTDAALQRYAMLVLVARKWGLHVSLTRFVHFGEPPAELRRRQRKVAKIDATMIAATQVGASVGEIFAAAQKAYAEAGFPDEWKLHHQGGASGYEPRSYRAVPGDTRAVLTNQAFAWNPSIAGAKSEDTILALPKQASDILSATPRLPAQTITVAGQDLPDACLPVRQGEAGLTRPDVLIR